MKLYELTKGDSFKLAGDDLSPVFIFDHVDGMYSYCTCGTRVVHLAAFAPVIRINNDKK